MLILVDVDGVVADLHIPWLARYNKDYDDNLEPIQITKWGIHEFVKPECGNKIYKYLQDPTIYDDCPVVVGAKEGVEELRKMGHRVVFLSAGFYPAKVEWLARKGLAIDFPYRASGDLRWQTLNDVILASDKSLIKGDLIIDDRYDNVKDWPRFILFDQPWNQDVGFNGRGKRALDWTKVVDIVGRSNVPSIHQMNMFDAGMAHTYED